MKDKIIVLGSDDEKCEVLKLLSLCTERLSENAIAKTYVITDAYADITETDEKKASRIDEDTLAVIPYEIKEKINVSKDKAITFSMNKNEADMTCINYLEHSDFNSFEIMTINGMGRVFMNKQCKFAPKTILICACILKVNGKTLNEILEIINSIVKY